MWSLTLEVVLFTSLVFFTSALYEPSVCQDCCPNGSCCEVQLNRSACCPFVNGVCCAGGKTCCPQGSVCDASKIACNYPNAQTTVPMKELVTQQSCKPKTVPQSLSDATHTVVCPDRTSACPDNSTCCPMKNDQWGCCPYVNAICCSDGLHCCAHGAECDLQAGGCKATNSKSVGSLESLLFGNTPLWPNLGKSRPVSQAVQKHADSNVWNPMAYLGTTCCRDSDNNFACCPFPDAVCCPDGVHCCPTNSACDLKAEKCVPTSDFLQTSFTLPQLCPDGRSKCPTDQTCCPLLDKDWGCCPIPDAVCCSDGLHCCPTGYRCNAEKGTCVKTSSTSTGHNKVVCPNEEFQCENGTTCCALPNDEWACCPFDKAVCCSDMAHCCPQNYTCDIEHNRCLASGTYLATADIWSLSFPPKSHAAQKTCPGGLVACSSESTCCPDADGTDSCCPYPDAVCCPNGRCCPKGHQCDMLTGQCSRVGVLWSQDFVPWTRKLPALRSSEQQQGHQLNLFPHDRLCPDMKSFCTGNRTCCPLKGDAYGCCPLDNGVCCSDGLHCCPAGSVCTGSNQCVRRLPHRTEETRKAAYKMVPTTFQPIHVGQLPVNNVELNEVVRANWCGACSYGEFCCPDASGRANQKCCPAAAGVCCSDGEHCCPRGSRCVGNNECEPVNQDTETYYAPYLVPTKNSSLTTSGFLRHIRPQSFDFPLAKNATLARIEPRFLVDQFLRASAHLYTVCLDRERSCSTDQRCCLSNKHGYVCAPKGAVCCSPDSDTYCPAASNCSADGLTCIRNRGPA
ncbi:hypothetical protein PHET_00725 [Paragonimus heterotremus]|uniref:Granulins domain-containing protein n=1 Tax=Paragonimus heterotremus TaxID=100268 RepID=A0A8J4TPD8_9TREM|nr:hypothetical protein PHET_00725 [Paragonimus heterotremus]